MLARGAHPPAANKGDANLYIKVRVTFNWKCLFAEDYPSD
jgi:hypothetical protein